MLENREFLSQDSSSSPPTQIRKIVFGLSFSAILWFSYRYVVQPTFSYTGLAYVEPDIYAVGYTTGLIVFISYVLPKNITSVGNLVYYLLFCFVFVPSIHMSSYVGVLQGETLYIMGLFVTMGAFIIRLFIGRDTKTQVAFGGLKFELYFGLLVAISVVIHLYVLIAVGFQQSFVSIWEVYDVRREFQVAANNHIALENLISAQAYFINPILLTLAITSRRRFLVFIVLLSQLALYNTTGYKSYLFEMLIMVFIAMFWRRSSKLTAKNLQVGTLSLLALITWIDFYTGGITGSTFIRRIVQLPGWLTNVYVGFYEKNEFHLLLNTSLNIFTTPNYAFAPPYVISEYLTGSPTVSFNANVLADGFAQFGYIGILVSATLTGLLLKFLNRALSGRPQQLVPLLGVPTAVVLSNSALLTSLLGHGILLGAVLIVFYPAKLYPGTSQLMRSQANFGD